MAHLSRALELLNQDGLMLTTQSSVYETEPVEAAGQPDFFNMVCAAKTVLKPFQLLDSCQQIEWAINEVKNKSGCPRRIDIDILFYDQQVIETETLTIPHPSWKSRNFVLTPLEEIACDWKDPVTNESVKEIWRRSTDTSRVRLVQILTRP